MRTPGRWVVTTSSGARHLIDSTDLDRVTVTRVSDVPDRSAAGFRRGTLRRDSEPLRVVAIHHDLEHGRNPGVQIGHDMWLYLEPLAGWATLTIRRSTPVLHIDVFEDDDVDGE